MSSKPSWKAARELARLIADEPAMVGGRPFELDGRHLSTVEVILRHWAVSSEPRLQLAFMEWAYGRPLEEEEHDKEVRISVSYEKKNGNSNNPTKPHPKTGNNLELPL